MYQVIITILFNLISIPSTAWVRKRLHAGSPKRSKSREPIAPYRTFLVLDIGNAPERQHDKKRQKERRPR